MYLMNLLLVSFIDFLLQSSPHQDFAPPLPIREAANKLLYFMTKGIEKKNIGQCRISGADSAVSFASATGRESLVTLCKDRHGHGQHDVQSKPLNGLYLDFLIFAGLPALTRSSDFWTVNWFLLCLKWGCTGGHSYY